MNSKDLLIISIFTFLTVVVWIVTDAYHAWVTSTVPLPLLRAIEPLSPRLDTAVISALKERGQVVKAPSFSTPETNIPPAEQLSTQGGGLPMPSVPATISPALVPTLTVIPYGASPSGAP